MHKNVFFNIIVLLFILFTLSNDIISQNNKEFRFVQITDTHLGIKKHNKRTKKIINSINELPFKIEFVVHTGDIFSNNIKNKEITKAGMDILDKLSVPIYYVPGNHDILGKNFKKTLKAYKTIFGYTDTVISINNIQCIFIYTEPICDNRINNANAKLKWLEDKLENNTNTIIFHHTPSVSDFYNNNIYAGWDTELQEQWTEIINKNNVTAVVAGHFHRNEIHWLNNVLLYVAPSVAGFWGRQATYRIYTCKNGKLSYKTVYIK